MQIPMEKVNKCEIEQFKGNGWFRLSMLSD